MSWFDDNQRTAPQPQPGGFTPLSAVGGGGGGLYQPMIAEMFRRVSGGTYTPTQQDIAQFGANPDPQYLEKIAPAIQQWWDANKGQNPTGAQPSTVYGPSAAYAPPPAGYQGAPGDQIAEMYRRVSGGTYTPTQQDIQQFGRNPDAQYLQKIGPAIQQWWDANKGQNPTGAQPSTVYGPSAPYQPPGAPGGTVMLRAPTGQTKAVPADQVGFYLARGAQRI